MLLQTTGVVRWDAWWTIWRLWPVLVIVLGINIAFGNRMPWLAGTLTALVLAAAIAIGIAIAGSSLPGEESLTTLEEPLDGVARVDVDIDLGAGTLSVGSLPETSTNLVKGELRSFGTAETRTSVTRSGDHAELSFSMEGFNFNLLGESSRRWEVWLSPHPRASIDVDAAAADLFLDLGDMNVSELSIVGGASDIEILPPEGAGHVSIGVDVAAANVVIVIPDHVGARIDTDVLVGNLSIDEARFPKADGVYMSKDFDTTANRVDLEIDAGASSVEIR